MTDINIQKFASGEERIFKPDANGDWKLSSHKPVNGQSEIEAGTLMGDCPAPWKPETHNEQSGG